MILNPYLWLSFCLIWLLIAIVEYNYGIYYKLLNWWLSLEWDSDAKYLNPSTFFLRRVEPLTWKKLFLRDKKAVLTTIFLIIVLLVMISSTFAYDKTFNETIYTDSLPTNGNYSLDFTLLENETLYFNVTNKDSKLGISVPESHLLNGTDTYKLIINWSVNDLIFTGNETLSSDIIITNSLNSNNYSVNVLIDVIKKEKRVFSIISSSSNVVYRNGTFYKNVSIIHDFPSKDKIDINIVGEPNEFFELYGCDDDWFLSCKSSSFNLDSEGKYKLQVPFRMEYTPIGKYNETFYLKSDSKNITLHAVFNVLQPTFKLNYGNIKGCSNYDNLSFVDQLNCTQSLLQYELEGIMQINEYFSKVNTENVCKNFVKTEYVVGDSISKEVLDRNINLSLDNERIRKQNSIISNDLDSCVKEKNTLSLNMDKQNVEKDKEIINLQNDNTRTRLSMQEKNELEKKEQTISTIFWLKWVTFIISLIFALVVLYKFWYERTYSTITKINPYLFGIISIFFALLWISLWFWG